MEGRRRKVDITEAGNFWGAELVFWLAREFGQLGDSVWTLVGVPIIHFTIHFTFACQGSSVPTPS